MGREKSSFFQMILNPDPKNKRTDAKAPARVRRGARPSEERATPFPLVSRQRRRQSSSLIYQSFTTTATSSSTTPSCSSGIQAFSSHYAHTFVIIIITLLFSCFLEVVEARSQHEYSLGESSSQSNSRITCYTCVNVSSNEECNKYAIDRPCPQGKDYCLTLHVMEKAVKSILVNKICATFEDCSGDSTGCYSLYGQMYCTSCCDQSYCNDLVPSNKTTAVFQRSSAIGTISRHGYNQATAVLLSNIALTIVWTLMNST